MKDKFLPSTHAKMMKELGFNILEQDNWIDSKEKPCKDAVCITLASNSSTHESSYKVNESKFYSLIGNFPLDIKYISHWKYAYQDILWQEAEECLWEKHACHFNVFQELGGEIPFRVNICVGSSNLPLHTNPYPLRFDSPIKAKRTSILKAIEYIHSQIKK